MQSTPKTSISDAVERSLEGLLLKAEMEYEAERARVEALLKECGQDKVQPAKDYWHRLDHLRRKVNLLRQMTEHG